MRVFAACLAVLSLWLPPFFAAAQSHPSSDEIVVTAQRSGIPVWRVRGAAGTLVLVGTIEDVAKGTNWNPEGLAVALRQADQIMFPEAVRYTGGFFSIMGASGKVKRMDHLAAGQSLSGYLPADEYRRLLNLRDRGALRPGFEARRPLFVAYDLMQAAKGERPGGFLAIGRVDWKTDPQGFVLATINKYKLRLVPMREESLNARLDAIASTPPAAQIPCLIAAARSAEAGSAAYQARSQDWSARRVAKVLLSPSELAYVSCAKIIRNQDDPAVVESTLLNLLRQPGTTIAVIELSTLAAPGACLDQLASAGFQISGPRWK